MALAVAAFAGGCESTRGGIATGVREKFSGPTYERRVFAAEPSRAFEAARTTIVSMGFRVTRAGAAQGVLEGLGGISSDDRLRGSSQRTIKVRIAPAAAAGESEVAVLFTEISEDSFGGGAVGATEAPLRGHPLYPAFFDRLAAELAPQ